MTMHFARTTPLLHTRLRVLATAATASALLLGLAGCSPAETSAGPAVVAEIPDSKIGELGDWLVQQLNDDESIDTEQLAARMDPQLSDGIEASDLAGILEERQTGAPWTVTNVKEEASSSTEESGGSPEVLFIRLESPSTEAKMILQIVRSTESGKLVGIYFLAPGAVSFE